MKKILIHFQLTLMWTKMIQTAIIGAIIQRGAVIPVIIPEPTEQRVMARQWDTAIPTQKIWIRTIP